MWVLRLPWVENCLPHWLHGYLTFSCTDSICLLRSLFEVAACWQRLQGYLTFSWTDSICLLRFLCCVNCLPHWLYKDTWHSHELIQCVFSGHSLKKMLVDKDYKNTLLFHGLIQHESSDYNVVYILYHNYYKKTWFSYGLTTGGRYLYTNVGRSRKVNWNIFNITAKLWTVNRHTLRKNVEFLFDTNWRVQNQHQAFFLRLHLRQGRWWVPCTDNIGSSVNHPVDLHFSEIHRNFFF